MTYKEQLAHPEWQKKRLYILERDKFTCQICLDTETQLHIHHQYYDKTFKTLAWEYPDYSYKTLCSDCHKALTDHINEHGTEKEFDVMKLKSELGSKNVVIYTKGRLILDKKDGDVVHIGEPSINKIVQFLINNWAKNG